MRFLAILAALPALSSAHCIAQRVRVNGQDNGQSVGIRVATSNNPISNVNDANIACKSGFQSPVSTKIIDVKAGDKVGIQWGHIIGGAQGGNDADHPIAKSHKGPVLFYMAKVDNAASASTSGQKWFKVYEDGLDSSGSWGVDRMISNGGWVDFNVPTCVAPGQYLLRAEIIALHSATKSQGVQFYMGCAQINVSGSGTKTGTTVSFPGAYGQSDPGILVSIYDKQGNPKGNGSPYKIPGPAVMTC
ncbi:glycosyl hydrolase family 61-domain-containing protein [Phaeosphaeria sp. MPI-PUGE-AT-0046c]|nr:glycosyl hydrolase family 61-domain-containing protein [Phaeosphaeria sp. MPI-PUGE-AT-0046c]